MIPAYVNALIQEINFIGEQTTKLPNYQTIHTIFFGGGTPSLLSPSQFDSVFRSIRANFNLATDAEITIEANPGTCTFANLQALRSIGINRISFGVQSANMEELRMLERTHDFFDVIEAVTSARKAGFDNLNLDLIYGLPEQTLQTWQTSVQRILDLHPEHISAYALTLEHGTPFGRWSAKGLMPLPDPDFAAEMYEWASETLEANGYVNYEISNWAKASALSGAGGRVAKHIETERSRSAFANPSFACKHNLQYWRSLPYLAFGAGAHGYANGYRYSNVLRIKTYIERLTQYEVRNNHLSFPLSPVTVNHHKQSIQDDMSEFMMTGLRLTQEGISEAEFANRFGTSLRDVYGKEIDELLKLGLIEWHSVGATGPSPLRVTQRARLLANQVFMRFV